MVAVVRLPVAGTDVVLRSPAGSDDILLLEAGPLDLRVALALLARLISDLDGASIDPASLPIADVDALLLRLRQRLVGDVVSAEEQCRAPGCHAHVDITFSIGAYLEHHRPAAPPDVEASAAGWYRLTGAAIEFRVPSAADQLAIARAEDPERALVERCVRAATDARDVRDVRDARESLEAALEAMAPSLCAELEGACPACGGTVIASFDPLHYTLRELRDQAALVYDDVCAIAHHYHWSEAEILALPTARRTRYAELAAEHVARGA